jgi:putative MFS transporter
MNVQRSTSLFSAPVIVAALGYFVDIYDLLLFTIVRVPSLQSLGLDDAQIRDQGLFIINMQMVGLFIGGVLWGMLGDKKGRLSVLFGSILLYSLGNIANGFVTTVDQYAWIRLIAGIGLAGELGVGITLVSEVLPKNKRGVGTSLVAGVGLFGAVAAYFVAQHFDWRTCYFIGGGLGILLLFLRVKVTESGMFENVKQQHHVSRGSFFSFFNDWERFKKYLLSILIGLPTWFVIGILVAFSKEFAVVMKLAEPVNPAKAIMFAYVGIAFGDIAIGFVSQWFKSRKKALFVFYAMAIVSVISYFNQSEGGSANTMYLICFCMGFSTGFWAIFVTMGAEQFGTNLRATAATTIPNMVRGSLPLIALLFKDVLQKGMGVDMITSGGITAVVVFFITIMAAWHVPETFHKDLDYVEEVKKRT